MRLNVQTDFALRVLMRLAMTPENLVTIETIATEYGISRNHLMKVAHLLGRLGYIETLRGRTGGLRLKGDPASIRIGEVVRQIEPDFHLVECFEANRNRCRISPACSLRLILGEALAGFIAILNQHTLADLMTNRHILADLIGVEA